MSRAIQQINRRAVIRAGIATLPAISAGTLPALGASAPAGPEAADPIFAAIAAREQTLARLNELGDRLCAFHDSHQSERELPSAEDHPGEDAERACGNADADALRTMFLTVPATAAGAVALHRYVFECESNGDDILQIVMDEEPERLGYHALIDALVAALTRLAA